MSMARRGCAQAHPAVLAEGRTSSLPGIAYGECAGRAMTGLGRPDRPREEPVGQFDVGSSGAYSLLD